MQQYGFLAREAEQTVGEVLRRKHAEGEIPPLLTVETHAKVRDAVALLHEHRVSQLPVVSAHDPHTVVGSVSERGLLRHAMDDPALLAAEIIEVMEAPFPAIAAEDGVRAAVELLADRREALLVNMDGRAAGIVTRADLLESLARWKGDRSGAASPPSAARLPSCRPLGSDPDPRLVRIPPIPRLD